MNDLLSCYVQIKTLVKPSEKYKRLDMTNVLWSRSMVYMDWVGIQEIKPLIYDQEIY